jgi:UDP:flavonoid glycosyltransferase YjiC (YdhE family)
VRIAFTTNPALGHLLPLVPLAQAARAAGHDVVVVGGASLATAVADAGLVHVVAGPPDLPSVFANVPDRVGLTGRRLAAVIWKQAFAGILAEAMAAAVLDVARSWRPDLVVHEDSEQGSWIAADVLGVPYIALQATAWRGTRFRLSDEPLNRLRAAHGLPPDPGLTRWNRFGFLTTRPPGLHDPTDPMPLGTRPIRPSAPDAPGGDPADWPRAGSGRPRVVVTMGTILAGRHEAMAAILDGLESLDVDVVAMVGHDVDPALLGQRRASTRVVQYVPITGLLESASLLVFHAGSGTMLAALAVGVPMVMLPVAADQPENAERCVAAGAAVTLQPDARGPDDVRAAAAGVLADPSLATAAAGLRDEIAAMPPPADLVPFLESLGRP